MAEPYAQSFHLNKCSDLRGHFSIAEVRLSDLIARNRLFRYTFVVRQTGNDFDDKPEGPVTIDLNTHDGHSILMDLILWPCLDAIPICCDFPSRS